MQHETRIGARSVSLVRAGILMETIFEFKVSKQSLAKIPAEERAFLFFLGHAINEISVLSKITYMSGNIVPEGHTLVEHVHVGQTLILLRILTGKIHEAWDRLRASPVRNIFRDDLSPDEKDAEKALNKAMDGNKFILAIRNVSFHYPKDSARLDDAFNALSEGEPWLFYLSDKVGNSFHYASELVMQWLMVDAVRDAGVAENDVWKRADDLFKTVTSISRQLVEVLMAYLIKIVERYLGDAYAAPILQLDAPELARLWLPYFIS
jgi:hypothetical protein